ncbi:MAG TPA: pilus assembly protein PilM [Tepidisphaeraceae bacterium]|jgi:type IV pilus assembly protein PilM
MVGRLKQWFGQNVSPIGVDLGTHTVRLAQCAHDGQAWRLIAAAAIDVPEVCRDSAGPTHAFLADALRDAFRRFAFVGRRAVLCVPSSRLHIRHLRMPRLDAIETERTLPFELAGHLPIDPARAVLRHQIAGEVQVNNEPRHETIVLAALRDDVEQLLRTAERARLDVTDLTVECKAIVDCFGHIYRRRSDANVTNCFIDIGAAVTRITIARGAMLMFARAIPVGGDTFSQAVADQLRINLTDARQRRIELASQPIARPEPQPVAAPAESPDQSFALLGLAPQAERRQQIEPVDIVTPSLAPGQETMAQQIQTATAGVLARLCEELTSCLRYQSATFPHAPVDRIIFVGGEARQRGMCQQIAQSLGLAAQLGDPMVRMGKTTTVGLDSGLDAKQPQPAWAVALGLSMGPVQQQLDQRRSA